MTAPDGNDLAFCESEPEVIKKSVKSSFHQSICLIAKSPWFSWFIIVTIYLNALFIGLETIPLSGLVPYLDMAVYNIFLGIYLLEFAIKLCAEPLGYWKQYHNLFDLVILVALVVHCLLFELETGRKGIMALKAIRALQTSRTLRSITLVTGLQVLVSAMIQTFKTTVIYLLTLLLIVMFLFAVTGYYLFGYDEGVDKENWGSFGRSLLSLFTFVTADGWTDLQNELSAHGYAGSEVFVVVFLILGHFIFTNLFIGAFIMNIHDATQEFEKQKRENKKAFIQEKKDATVARQHQDVMDLIEKQRENNFLDFFEMTKEFEKSLRHDDFTYTADLCTTIPWMETLVSSLQHLEKSKIRSLELYHELGDTLLQMKETQLARNEHQADET